MVVLSRIRLLIKDVIYLGIRLCMKSRRNSCHNMFYVLRFKFLSLTFLLSSFSGLSVMSRLARNRLQQSEYDIDERSIDWDHIEM